MSGNDDAIVLDASVALAWCFPDESSDDADAVFAALHDQKILVPSIWALEITNALLVGERRKRIRPPEAQRFVELLRDLRIVEDSQPYVETVRNVLPLARKHELSAYDAAYVDVALRYAVPLATLDAALRKAVQAAGGRVLKV